MERERTRGWGDPESLGCWSREELDAELAKMNVVEGPHYGERVLPDGRRQYCAFFRRMDGPRFREGRFPEGFNFGPCLARGCTSRAVAAWFCEEHLRDRELEGKVVSSIELGTN